MQQFGPLQDGAYTYLQNAIINGDFEENTIYSINTISESLNMSRTPVRDAVRRLEQDGYINILPSRGFVVHSLTEDEIIDLYQTRCAVEGFCCRSIAKNYHNGLATDIVLELKQSLERQNKLINHNYTTKNFLMLDEQFHSILVSAVNNSNFNNIINNLNGRINRFRYNSIIQAGCPELTIDEHQAIIDAICSGEEEASYTALKKHLDTPFASNLKVIDGGHKK